MTLAAVRPIRSSPVLQSVEDLEAFEQELVDQFALAAAASGVSDGYVARERAVVFSFLRFLGRSVWTASVDDGDRFLVYSRKDLRLSPRTVHQKAASLGRFYSFLLARYQGEVYRLTGHVLEQPIDTFNRPHAADYAVIARVPPSDAEIDALFGQWRDALPTMRKYLPSARDYLAASLWRRSGLRINETVMCDIRDWRPDLGEQGKLHVRFGKGSFGRGPKSRLVPAINATDTLLGWWLTDVRHQYGVDYLDPDAPMLPSERHDHATQRCARAGADALRSGLANAVQRWLPSWTGRLTPHVLRHYCASSLYARGLDLKAIQSLLGHDWLSTTTRYIHVHDNHVEQAWTVANTRVAARLSGEGR
jgi:site-specific recombinase XerD